MPVKREKPVTQKKRVSRKRAAVIALLAGLIFITGAVTLHIAILPESTPHRDNITPPLNEWTPFYSFEIRWENMQTNPGDVALTWNDLDQEDKEFLDTVQKTAFQYFWSEANPNTGLVQDRATSKTVSSIAATGFGLSAICVAESRGWIKHDEAYERVLNTLKSFDPSDPLVEGSHGFFYHFVNTATGRREWDSEISLIDTAMLMAGVLHAGQHFKGTEIEALADRIYRAVEWDWLLSGDLLRRTPTDAEASGYDEYIIAYLLALGSPSHPIPERSWDAWARTYRWYDYGEVKFLTPQGGRTMLAYLYQFPSCWIDFRDKHDAYANYWNEFKAALRANMDYCLDESRANGWPLLWGWTACDGKNGYLGYRDTFDGTVAPSAVAAAVPFIPENVIPMLKKIYQEYGSLVWREYGFTNAFNPSQEWYDQDYVGIDQGNMVLMIEAFRSGNVWAELMQIPYVRDGLLKAGFYTGFHPDKNGFVRDWLLIGSFREPGGDVFDTDFIGEPIIGTPKAGESMFGKNWVPYHSSYGEPTSNYIDLFRAFEERENAAAYAFTLLNFTSEKTLDVFVGSDDSIKVWINDELVHENNVARGARADQDRIEGVHFREGLNRVLVKVCNISGGWGFYFRTAE
jgi:hypothetical protein